ncbi:MAG TPA: DUF1801 domain-containing protein [Pyrinomonadaceae bacterium]|nr:DUF1801 domain-containing protein [Pyrinomonadaceae bacterium]
MRSVNTYGTFEDCISQSSPQAQKLARALRKLVADVYPDAVEVPWPNQQVIGYGVGPKKATEHFGYIGAHSNHVNLGFNRGSELADPEGLLEGTGKKFRHVKIQKPEDARRPALRELIRQAVRERKLALGAGD